ncbi:MAG TPA: diguanylate cyclase [Terriglobales bacterium]|jgi:diguanylate cyclase (GGDEF)-like protein/PAS domain S-box-containing protein|nr:diguanylate cyclase [Terriglobales bacterium]
MPTLLNPEIFRTVLERLQTGVYLVDTDRRILFWSDGAERITGYLRHQVLGHFCRENILMYCDGKSCGLCGSACPLSETMHEGRPKEARVYFRHKLGHQVPVNLRVVPIRDDRGSMIGAAESFDEQVADSHDDDLAPYGCLDATTGIPNHKFTQSHLRESLATYSEYRVPFSVLCIHVDRLEHVQATHGREAIAFVLRAAAGTIKNVLGQGAFVGRWKENEFLAIMTAWSPVQTEKAVENIQKIVSCSSVRWWDDQLFVHVTVGHTAVWPGDSIESLIERVDLLRRNARAQGNDAAKASGVGQ